MLLNDMHPYDILADNILLKDGLTWDIRRGKPGSSVKFL